MTEKNKISLSITNESNQDDRSSLTTFQKIDSELVINFLNTVPNLGKRGPGSDRCSFLVTTTNQTETHIYVPCMGAPAMEETSPKIKEIKIRMYPNISNCKCKSNSDCPKLIASGECPSPFVKKYIGELLLPSTYQER
jgi:hypothetical protein